MATSPWERPFGTHRTFRRILLFSVHECSPQGSKIHLQQSPNFFDCDIAEFPPNPSKGLVRQVKLDVTTDIPIAERVEERGKPAGVCQRRHANFLQGMHTINHLAQFYRRQLMYVNTAGRCFVCPRAIPNAAPVTSKVPKANQRDVKVKDRKTEKPCYGTNHRTTTRLQHFGTEG
jgi:hypothetical protein